MKKSSFWFTLSMIFQIYIVAQKLDGTLNWPWWSWNPVQGSVFIVWVWLAYLVAVSLIFLNLGKLMVWIGRRIETPKDGQ